MKSAFAYLFFVATLQFPLSAGVAAGDFPLASCKGWNATLTERIGVNSVNAVLRGITTQADFAEYCLRDPGGETIAYGGKLTVDQCALKYLHQSGGQQFSASANCETKSLIFYKPGSDPVQLTFPRPDGEDTSCASGYPPIEGQFALLCPEAAEEIGISTE